MNWLNLNRSSGKLFSRWESAYQGETTVRVNGATYGTRQAARPGIDQFEERRQQVGCIWSAFGSARDFPPPSVCALFPELVPAMYSLTLRKWIYKGEGPQTVTMENGDVVMSLVLAISG